jgi:hypothetical protein
MTEGGIEGLAATIGVLREDVARLRRFVITGRQANLEHEQQLARLMRDGVAQVQQMRTLVDRIGAHPQCTPATVDQLDEFRQLLASAEFDLAGIAEHAGPVAPVAIVGR